MRRSYAVTWRGRDGRPCSGGLELTATGLRLDGIGPAGVTSRDMPYPDLRGVRIGREPAERIAGRPALVVETRKGDAVRIAGVAEPGVVGELAERLALRLRR